MKGTPVGDFAGGKWSPSVMCVAISASVTNFEYVMPAEITFQ
jgi:hypothetical protein